MLVEGLSTADAVGGGVTVAHPPPATPRLHLREDKEQEEEEREQEEGKVEQEKQVQKERQKQEQEEQGEQVQEHQEKKGHQEQVEEYSGNNLNDKILCHQNENVLALLPWDVSRRDASLVYRDRGFLQQVASLQGSWGKLAGGPACWRSWHRAPDSPWRNLVIICVRGRFVFLLSW